MAQTTIFLDTFTGDSGLAISARSPETGSWAGVGDAHDVKLDGDGFAHRPGSSGELAPYLPLPEFYAPVGCDSVVLAVSFKIPSTPPNNWAASAWLTCVSVLDDLEYGLSTHIFDGGGGSGVIEIDVAGLYTVETLNFTITAGEEFTVVIRINAGESATHEVEVFGPAWSESIPIEGAAVDYLSLPIGAALEFNDNSQTRIGSFSIVANGEGEGPGQYTVDGASTTMYGQPRMTHAVAGAESTRYGAILAKYDVSARVAPQEPSTRSGTPLAWLLDVDAVGTIHGAYGACTTGAGIPRAGHPQIGEVHGASTTESGSPTSRVRVIPEAAHTTMAGQPGATARVSVEGVCGTKYGTPSGGASHAVSGSCLTKYGKPKVSFPNGCRVYGLNNGRRAGVPRAVEIA